MEYRQLGRSGLKVSVLTMGTMTFGGKGVFAKVGDVSLDEVRRLIDIVADAGVNLIDTANIYSAGRSEEMIGEAMPTRKPGMLIATKARFPMGQGPNDRGLVALASDPRVRGEPPAPAHRRDRSLPAAPVGRPDAARGDDGGARCARALGQGAVRRLFELLRLAHDEGDGGRAARRPRPLRFGADPLHAAGARGGIRTPADRGGPGPRRPGLEPAGRRPAVRKTQARQGGARRHAAVLRLDRAAGARRERAVEHRRRARRDRRGAWRVGGADRAGLAARAARR